MENGGCGRMQVDHAACYSNGEFQYLNWSKSAGIISMQQVMNTSPIPQFRDNADGSVGCHGSAHVQEDVWVSQLTEHFNFLQILGDLQSSCLFLLGVSAFICCRVLVVEHFDSNGQMKPLCSVDGRKRPPTEDLFDIQAIIVYRKRRVQACLFRPAHTDCRPANPVAVTPHARQTPATLQHATTTPQGTFCCTSHTHRQLQLGEGGQGASHVSAHSDRRRGAWARFRKLVGG
mmetsp:Transcript_43689/g.107209  ORF Transcript_43689/g.107209 Transcript_43689/m.107209 type:complete len:232 (-) Transcript_43689:447-1142(-)